MTDFLLWMIVGQLFAVCGLLGAILGNLRILNRR
jgi:hypothetical protein